MIEFLGLTLGAASLLYWWLSARWLRQWMEVPPAPSDGAPLPPVTFFRPIKPGVPRLREKLEALVRATQPGDQILLGVAPGSAEAAIAAEVQRAFRAAEVELLDCRPGAALNPKISKLGQMEMAARHEHWLITDSEAVLEADWVARFRREWQSCDVLTAGHRFVRLHSWPQRLDAAAVLLTLWPGLASVRRWSVPRLTLGACTGLRRGDLTAVGGWAAFGGALAEDHQLGAALAAAGRRIIFSREIISLEADALSWRDYWRHQRRMSLTYRVANPAGFAGMILTQGVMWTLLAALLAPASVSAWLAFFALWAGRWWTARDAAGKLGFQITRLGTVVLAAALVETWCWWAAWFTQRVWWSGEWRLVSRQGLLEHGASSPPEKKLQTSITRY